MYLFKTESKVGKQEKLFAPQNTRSKVDEEEHLHAFSTIHNVLFHFNFTFKTNTSKIKCM